MSQVEQTPEFKSMFTRALDEHSKLLVDGDVVRKWPGRKKLQKVRQSVCMCVCE
jgi:hypothetical protein